MASSADQIDRELAAAALRKRAKGETPTQREIAALRRIEKVREAADRQRFYRTIPKGDWREWSGRQHKVLNEQADRYGLPIGSAEIDLPAVVRWLHDFLAENKHRLAAVGERSPQEADGPTEGELDAAKLDYLRERTRISRIEADRRAALLIPRDQVHQCFGLIAGVLRQASENLNKRFGEDAFEILADALATADDHLASLVATFSEPPDPSADSPETTRADPNAAAIAAGDDEGLA